MVTERTPLWREAARLCKKWLDAKEEYDALLRKHYPLTHGKLIEMPSDEDVLQAVEVAREKETEAHRRYRDAYFKALGGYNEA